MENKNLKPVNKNRLLELDTSIITLLEQCLHEETYDKYKECATTLFSSKGFFMTEKDVLENYEDVYGNVVPIE